MSHSYEKIELCNKAFFVIKNNTLFEIVLDIVNNKFCLYNLR